MVTRLVRAGAVLLFFFFAGQVLGPGSQAQAKRIAAPPQPLRFCFAPLGSYDSELLALARQGAEYLYGAHTELLPASKLPRAAYYKPRKRYRAELLLAHLESLLPSDRCDIIVGITSVDISTTKGSVKDWGILGLGSIAGTTGVVSSFRMIRKVDRATQKRRMISTVNHEIGHVLGAPHGGAPGCLMNDAQGSVKTIDTESGLLCEDSRKLIEAHIGRALPRIETFDWSRFL